MTKIIEELRNGAVDYKSEEDVLTVFYNSKINLFGLLFNGKFWSYKTQAAFIKKRNYFIDKYNLEKEIKEL